MRLDYIRKVKSMAKNDYYVIVYRVLMYLYNCLRQDEVVDMQKLTPEYLHINQRYFEYIFDTVNDEGLILNKAYYEDMLRWEEHTSELQSRFYIVSGLLLEKKQYNHRHDRMQ